MSAKNSCENKKKRRAERTEHATQMETKRRIQRRLEYLAYAPPDTFDDLEAEVDKVIEEENSI